MDVITRIRQLHRVAVAAVAWRMGLSQDRGQNNHRLTSRPSLRHHDPARRRVLVGWQERIGDLFS